MRSRWLLITVFTAAGARAEEAAAPAYGEAYVALERERFSGNAKHALALSWGKGLANPLFESDALDLKYAYQLREGLFLGVGGSLQRNEESDFSRRLRQNLSEEGYRAASSEPRGSLKLTVDYAPLGGLLNLFSRQVMSFDVAFNLGLGTSFLKNPDRHSFLLEAGLSPTLQVAPHFGLTAGLFYLEDFVGPENLKRVDFRLGALCRF